jgi:co-chaperonin GroES (HSP10)
MAINVKPPGGRVLVQPLEEKGGIIIPDTAKEKPQEDTVTAVGTDRYGHPEGINLTTLVPGIYDHVVAAPHVTDTVTSKEMIQGKKSPTSHRGK